MAREKPRWRRVMNGRYLRWKALVVLVRLVPALQKRLAFFPRSVGMIEAADVVLADTQTNLSKMFTEPEHQLLTQLTAWDSTAPDFDLRTAAVTGQRAALYRNAWIDTKTSGVLLPERQATMLPRGQYANWNAISARIDRKQVRIPGRVWTPLPTRSYYHFFIENGLRFMEAIDLFGTMSVVVPPQLGRVERNFWEAITAQFPKISVRMVPVGSIVVADEVAYNFPASNNYEWQPIDPAHTERMRQLFIGQYGSPRNLDSRLYLSRGGAKLRQPTNGEELEALLKGKNFTSFVADESNHREQIDRFHSADTIIAVHGAGLTNLIFARPGTRVIEIFPENFIKSTYWWISRQLGLHYTPLIGGPGNYDQHFAAPLDALENLLDEID